MAKVPKQPEIILEHTTDAELEGNVIDGMDALLGDDISASDYVAGEEWPGVPKFELPEPYRREGQVERVTDDE